MVLGHGAVAARTSEWFSARRMLGMCLVTRHARTEGTFLRRMIRVRGGVAAGARLLSAFADVVGIVAARASAVCLNAAGAQRLVSSVATFAGRRCRLPEVMRTVAAIAGLVSTLEGRARGNDGRLGPMALHAGLANAGRRAVWLVAIETLLMNRPGVCRACSVMQVYVLVTLEARFWLQSDLTMRLVAVEAWLVGMHQNGRMVALSILVAVQAFVPLAKEYVGRTDAEVQGRHAESSRVVVGRVLCSFALEDVTARAVVGGALGPVMQPHVGMAGVAGVGARHFELPLSDPVAVLATHAARHVRDVARALSREAPTWANFGRSGGFRRTATGRERRPEDAEQEHEAFESSARKRASASRASASAAACASHDRDVPTKEEERTEQTTGM